MFVLCIYFFLYITWQYALLCYRATGVTLQGLLSFMMISFMALYMCQVVHVLDFFGSRRMETTPTSIEVLLRPTQSQSDEPSDLRGSLSPTSLYSTWQSQPVTHPIMNQARRCLALVIEHKPLSERRIPYIADNN